MSLMPIIPKAIGDTPADFTILSSIYTTPVANPTTIYAGQPVTLTIAVATDRAKGNKGMTQRPYLIPCPTGGCAGTSLSVADKGNILALCSRTRDAAVTTSEVTGLGTDTLTTTFSIPITPNKQATSYGICVPYCFNAGRCQSAISWALVNSNTPIKFTPTDPLSYTIAPGSPKTLTFTGTALKKGDKIRILPQGKVAQGGLCPISTATNFPNSEYEAEVTATAPVSVSTSISFTIEPKYADLAIGQVCYSRVSTIVWIPVFQTPLQTPLYFSLENADVPTLYQEVRLKIRKGPTDLPAAPVFESTDKFYFIEKVVSGTGENPCTVTPTPKDVTLWTVDKVGAGVDFAMATVIIKDPQFTVGKTYKMCYIKNEGKATASVHGASSTLMGADTPISFTIHSTIYTTPVMTPTPVYAGQPVTLTIAVTPDRAKGNKGMTQRPYLIPCPTGSCAGAILTEADKSTILALCSRDTREGAVTTSEVTGLGTNTLTTKFTAPVTPIKQATSYGICVPYCFKAGKCDSTVSWALVNSDTPIKFPAKPTTEPQSPPKKSDKDGKPDTVPLKPEVTKTIPATPTSDPIVVRPQHNKTTTTKGESATAISSTIPSVLIISVVFLYLYK